MQPRPPVTLEPKVRLHRNTEVPQAPPIAPGLYLLVGLLLLFGFSTALTSLIRQGTQDIGSLREEFTARRKVPNHTIVKRGEIYDRTGLPLAHSLPVWECWVSNKTIHDAVRPVLAGMLAEVTGVSAARLEELLMSGHWGPTLYQSLDDEQLAALREWKANGWRRQVRAYATSEAGQHLIATAFEGNPDEFRTAIDRAVGNVIVRQTYRREYPFGTLAGQVIGYVTWHPGVGLAPGGGVEYWTQQQLAPILVLPGETHDEANHLTTEPAADEPKPLRIDKTPQAVQVTLDAEIQAYTELALAQALERTGSTAAAAVILEADSGDILAMASLPAFDPGLFRTRCEAAFRDPALLPLDEVLPAGEELLLTDGVTPPLLERWPLPYQEREQWAGDLPPGLIPGTTAHHRMNNAPDLDLGARLDLQALRHAVCSGAPEHHNAGPVPDWAEPVHGRWVRHKGPQVSPPRWNTGTRCAS